MTVVMAAKGYPDAYDKGAEIGGLDDLPETSSQMVFHAGTTAVNGTITASGGRVLNVTARAETLQEAAQKAYAMVDAIDFPDGFCRRAAMPWPALLPTSITQGGQRWRRRSSALKKAECFAIRARPKKANTDRFITAPPNTAPPNTKRRQA